MADAVLTLASDASLVGLIRDRRSEVACRALYRRHTPALLRTAWLLLGQSEDDADDAVQEAWIRALTALDRWREELPFGTWIRGIVVHVALDMLRRERRLTTMTVEIEGHARVEGYGVDLERAIAALSPGYRAVLVLHDVEGFTHDEIGERLGITPGTSRGQLFKARRAIRARLAPTEAEERHD
jgi:RNA polymerase sigma-70 factor (ECF subfamily)